MNNQHIVYEAQFDEDIIITDLDEESEQRFLTSLLQDQQVIRPNSRTSVQPIVDRETQSVSSPRNNQLRQVVEYLNERYEFRKNEIRHYREFRKKGEQVFQRLTDHHLKSSWKAICLEAGIKCSWNLVDNLIDSDFAPYYNPLLDYFNNLPEWEGTTDFIEMLGSSVTTTNELFWKDCLKRWLVGLVATILEPDKVNQTVLVLSGGQNIGKTTWIRSLLPAELSDYCYSGTIYPRRVDSKIKVAQHAIILLDELNAMSKGDIEVLKELITSTSIDERLSYRRDSEKMIRIASFAATVNSEQFLFDTTGNRRFLSNKVTDINLNHGIEMANVFSQALALFNNGFQYWYSKEETALVEEQNAAFVELTEEEEYILRLFEPWKPEDGDYSFFTSTEVAQMIKEKFNAPQYSAVKIGLIMNKHFERCKPGRNYGYKVKVIQ